MEKQILMEYIDACELIRETEQDIQRLKRKKSETVQGSVKGSNPDFPYQEQHFHVGGTAYTYADDTRLRLEETILRERRENASNIKIKVEQYMNTIPVRMQRIIRYKYFEGMSWEQVADRIGRMATGDSVRMEVDRFFFIKVQMDLNGNLSVYWQKIKNVMERCGSVRTFSN